MLHDTGPEMEARWLERLRAMPKETLHLTSLSLAMHREGLRRRSPNAAERDLDLASCAAHYGPALAGKAYGAQR